MFALGNTHIFLLNAIPNNIYVKKLFIEQFICLVIGINIFAKMSTFTATFIVSDVTPSLSFVVTAGLTF